MYFSAASGERGFSGGNGTLLGITQASNKWCRRDKRSLSTGCVLTMKLIFMDSPLWTCQRLFSLVSPTTLDFRSIHFLDELESYQLTFASTESIEKKRNQARKFATQRERERESWAKGKKSFFYRHLSSDFTSCWRWVGEWEIINVQLFIFSKAYSKLVIWSWTESSRERELRE